MGEHKNNEKAKDKKEWNDVMGGEQSPLTGESIVIGAELMAYGYAYIDAMCQSERFSEKSEEDRKHLKFMQEHGLDVVKNFGNIAKFVVDEAEKSQSHEEKEATDK